MLLEFRLENHRSIREEQALTFEASDRIHPESNIPRRVEGKKERVLPAAAIYGPNASGKSNILSGLQFMREAVINSYRFWNPVDTIPRMPFAWGESKSGPSTYEVRFIDAVGMETRYGFVLSDTEIEEEWLDTYPENQRKRRVFERKKSKVHHLKHDVVPKSFSQLLRPNALYLSMCSQFGILGISDVFRFFRKIAFPVGSRFQRPGSQEFERLAAPVFPSLGQDEQRKLFDDEFGDRLTESIRSMFRDADIGIVDIKKFSTDQRKSDSRLFRSPYLFQHEAGNDESWLGIEDESAGTQTLLRLAPLLVNALWTGGVVVVDELESSLHTRLTSTIVSIFNDPECNPTNAQLLFTSHDSNLLGNSLGDPVLRRDQVWLTEKAETGGTRLYPLTDYKPRKAENLERGYLQGRYGGIPFLGGFADAFKDDHRDE